MSGDGIGETEPPGTEDGLRWASARLAEAGAEVRRVAALGPGVLSAPCLPLASALEDTAAEAAELARAVRRAADRAEALAVELARRLLTAAAHAGTQPGHDPDPVTPAGGGRWAQWPPHPTPVGHRWAAPGDQPVWRQWPEHPAPTVRPGTGPLLGGTDGLHPDPGFGVDIPRLPDGPP